MRKIDSKGLFKSEIVYEYGLLITSKGNKGVFNTRIRFIYVEERDEEFTKLERYLSNTN